uniref:NADH-ubiquinone oxidoreductase chain 2 n=1 Tax=Tenebrionoidea sp. 1 KM-2017 TaxID=2219464 RepID=A0A346RJD4_9CUCU|nr:NADH dehydrogenase subunit 2 [Tenebrionoidea sp. 1 KM-2017]
MLKFYKMNFFMLMMFGTIITISSYSWFGMWMGLEINMLSVIPLFSSQNNMFSSEASMKYFITQALASLAFILSIIVKMNLDSSLSLNLSTSIMTSAILTKMGAAPFHFWFPEVMEGLNWLNAMILLTWQKIAPMMIMFNMPSHMKLLLLAVITSLIISGVMAIKMTSLRKIMTFSSINNIAWMLSAIMISNSFWFIYLLVYSIIVINMSSLFHKTKMFFIPQMINSMNTNKYLKISLLLNFLSMAGLPPFIGFMPKWFLINEMIGNKMIFLSFSLILFTLIMAFTYVNMMITSLMLTFNEPKMNTNAPQIWLLNLSNLITISSLIFYSLVNFIA